MDIKLSLICPIYNVEKYIPDLLESLLLGVNSEEVEIVFIDDCSPDNSISIIKNFLNIKKNEIRFLTKVIELNENVGLSGARNEGVNLANGNYIGFLDSDDAISTNYWAIISKYLKNDHLDILEFSYKEFADTLPTTIINEKVKELIVSKYSPFYSGFFVWTRVYKNKLVADLRFPKGLIFEDVYYSFNAYAKANNIKKINSELVYYRQREGSLTAKRNSKYSDLLRNLLSECSKNINYFPDKVKLLNFVIHKSFILILKGMKINSSSEKASYFRICYPMLLELKSLTKAYSISLTCKLKLFITIKLCWFLK